MVAIGRLHKKDTRCGVSFCLILLQKYDIFARVGASESLLQNKLEFYGAEEMEHSLLGFPRAKLALSV